MPALRPDLIHLHDHYGYKALLEAHLCGVPSVYTVHRVHHEFSQWLLCEHVSVRLADQVTAVGHSYRQENAAFFAAARHPARAIPNGCDLAFWRLPHAGEPAARRAERRTRLCERHGFSAGVTLAYLGRLNADQKGVDLLLEAVCHQLRDMDVNLLIIGEGDAGITAAIRQAAAGAPHRLGFENRLYTPAEVRDVLGAVDMLVVPSRYEPFGLVQIEAMAMGALPVVAATGGLRDVAIDVSHENGFAKVFPPGNANALAEGIREMCRVATAEPERFHGWRRRAIDEATGYSAGNMANAYAELYRTMITKGKTDDGSNANQ